MEALRGGIERRFVREEEAKGEGTKRNGARSRRVVKKAALRNTNLCCEGDVTEYYAIDVICLMLLRGAYTQLTATCKPYYITSATTYTVLIRACEIWTRFLLGGFGSAVCRGSECLGILRIRQ